MAELAATTRERGPDLLLRHCDALTDVDQPSPYTRLEAAVGRDLARMLVAGLARRRRTARLAA